MAGGIRTASAGKRNGRGLEEGMRKPNFLVIGAQKSGTTYLCAALARHPEVFHSTPKELLFFQRRDVTPESFDAYLREHFAAAGEQRWVGEGSAVYLQWPGALRNVRRCLGDELAIFVCLRQPTDRAVSFYLHNLRKGRLKGDERIADIDDDIRISPLKTSFYADHIGRWLDAYGDRIRFLLFDDLVSAPERFVRDATDHLGIEPLGAQIKDDAVNRGFELEWNAGALTVAGEMPAGTVRPRFTLAELEDVHARFQDDIARTSALIGRSLAHWRQMPEFTAKQANF
jgi:hypothetical protein